MTRSNPVVLLGILACLLASCAENQPREPRVRELSEVRLRESDSSYVGVASGFAVTPRGTFLIADVRNAVLHEFSRDGSEVRRVGRRGEGPGEWANGPQVLVWGDDSTFAAADGFTVRVMDYPSLQQRWSTLRPTWSLPVGYHREQWVFNKVDAKSRTSLHFVRSASDSVVPGGPVTPSIGRSPIIDDYFSFLAVAPARGDTIGVFIMNADRLYFGPAPKGPWDSVDVPAVRRRGAVPSLMEALERGDMRAAETRLYEPSFPVALHYAPSSDAFVLITSDRALEAGSRMTGKLFLSLVVPRTRSACVDLPLPVPSDPQPQVAFRGDTLFVLSQSSDSLAVTRTTVRAFVLDSSSCA